MKVAAQITFWAVLFAMVGVAQAQQAGYATARGGLLSNLVSAGHFAVLEEDMDASGCGGESCSGDCDGDSSCACQDPCVSPAWIGSIDYLHWKPRREGFDVAFVDPNAGNGIIDGGNRSLELESNSGVRVNFGRQFSSGWDVTFTYTNFYSDDALTATAPAGGAIWSTRGGRRGTLATSVTGAATLDMDDFAVEAGYWFFPYHSVSLRVFGGVRGASFHQRMFVNAQGGALPAGGAQAMQASQVDALGIRFGGESHWYIGENLSLFGRAAGSVLMGDFETAYAETNNTAGLANWNITDAYFQMVPVMEVAAGVNLQRGPWSVQAGYELSTWFGMALEEDIYRPGRSGRNLGLDGLFVRFVRAY